MFVDSSTSVRGPPQRRSPPAREALVTVQRRAADFAREGADLRATTVTEQQWGSFLDTYVR